MTRYTTPASGLPRAGSLLWSALALAACGGAATQTEARAPSPEEEAAVVAVQRLSTAADQGDADALEGLLHARFGVSFTRAESGEVAFMTREQYLAGIRAGTLGGSPRTLEVAAVRVNDAFAHVEVQRAGAGPRFESDLTLVRTPAGWQLLADTTVLRTPAP